jgi:hypothetical protein
MVPVSTFTWLDRREEDVERVREALAAFDEQGMVDPLGFGVVRDAFSEQLFPGISTVQTRARYFLLVPWVYRRLDEEGSSPGDGTRRARELEVELIEALLRGSSDHSGIIGRSARQTTKQLPSFVYWGGLGRWGIRRFEGTRHDYIRSLGQRRRLRMTAEEQEGAAPTPWHPDLPEEPSGLYEEASLRLRPEEGEFLRDRILVSVPGTFLAFLVRDGSSDQVADEPWNHPLVPSAPQNIQRCLYHAKLFAIAAWGAGLAYNAELSALLEGDGGGALDADYDAEIDDWLRMVESMSDDYARWSRDEFWAVVHDQNPAIARPIRNFVDWWLDEVTADPRRAVSAREARTHLHHREAQIKGPRAKLANRRARERSPVAQGDVLLVFRWRQASQIISDIHEGLESHAESA